MLVPPHWWWHPLCSTKYVHVRVPGLLCRAKLAWRAICKFLRHVACRGPCGLVFHVPLSLAEGATVCSVAIPTSLQRNHVATRVPRSITESVWFFQPGYRQVSTHLGVWSRCLAESHGKGLPVAPLETSHEATSFNSAFTCHMNKRVHTLTTTTIVTELSGEGSGG